MPGFPRKVEKLWKKTAKLTGSFRNSPMITSANLLSPNRFCLITVSFATTSEDRFSYSANSRMKDKISGTSSADASRIEKSASQVLCIMTSPCCWMATQG